MVTQGLWFYPLVGILFFWQGLHKVSITSMRCDAILLPLVFPRRRHAKRCDRIRYGFDWDAMRYHTIAIRLRCDAIRYDWDAMRCDDVNAMRCDAMRCDVTRQFFEFGRECVAAQGLFSSICLYSFCSHIVSIRSVQGSHIIMLLPFM